MSQVRSEGFPQADSNGRSAEFVGQALLTLSFDDGREDFWRVARPVLLEFGITATINVITGWVDGTWPTPPYWRESSATAPLTVEQVQELHREGFEIGSHADRHTNEPEDISASVNKLREWGVADHGTEGVSFSSPFSELSPGRAKQLRPVFRQLGIASARSGPKAPDHLHTDNLVPYPPPNRYCLPSQVITCETRLEQVQNIIAAAMDRPSWCILQLHSILRQEDPGYGADPWYWDAGEFEALCRWLKGIPAPRLLIVTQRDGYRLASSAGRAPVPGRPGTRARLGRPERYDDGASDSDFSQSHPTAYAHRRRLRALRRKVRGR